MLKYFEKTWCYILLIVVILLRKMNLQDPNGNFQIIAFLYNAHYHIPHPC